MSSSLLTKKALAASLKRLMQEIPLNKISVKDLTEECHLNRQTFYYHFQDIYELLGWIYQTEAVDAIAQERSYHTWTHGLHTIFTYIEENKAVCLNTLNSLGRNHLDSYLYTMTNPLILGVVNEVSSGRQVPEQDKLFIANFYTLAFTGLVIQWMQGGMRENPSDIIGRLSRLVEGNFERALDRYEHKRS
ncbi:TetR/AcrR family transcriptional regulator [Paenibacillus sp. J22TS3]|uniref:TetR/AcrR family transcriptional regulator n=1 Tax=Paenibacillus sp. J22TS3 TaxID=2807192 RepID=UPI001B14AC8C|nr:TetR/AcrR family transcriptional regulator [Paenibacillus sp. J22TS3]GIP21147.1 TetR family transcriptional regulator [Paenibacillus sp. J22TS3]